MKRPGRGPGTEGSPELGAAPVISRVSRRLPLPRPPPPPPCTPGKPPAAPDSGLPSAWQTRPRGWGEEDTGGEVGAEAFQRRQLCCCRAPRPAVRRASDVREASARSVPNARPASSKELGSLSAVTHGGSRERFTTKRHPSTHRGQHLRRTASRLCPPRRMRKDARGPVSSGMAALGPNSSGRRHAVCL